MGLLKESWRIDRIWTCGIKWWVDIGEAGPDGSTSKRKEPGSVPKFRPLQCISCLGHALCDTFPNGKIIPSWASQISWINNAEIIKTFSRGPQHFLSWQWGWIWHQLTQEVKNKSCGQFKLPFQLFFNHLRLGCETVLATICFKPFQHHSLIHVHGQVDMPLANHCPEVWE